MKLLIVDDSLTMRDIIEGHMTNYNIDIVGTAKNGVEAIEMFKDKQPDVVTMDITMPEMDGITCLENMISIKPNTKIMMITALNDKYTGLQAIEKGARGFLYKPVNPDDLFEAFDELLDRV